MKRVLVFLLVLVMALSVGGVLAFAAEQKNTEDLKQMLLDLDYDVYTMESQSYEGESIAPDESTILLYSPEGYGLVSSYDSDFGFYSTFVLRFVSEPSIAAILGETGSYSINGQTITITDEDGWTAVFTPSEHGTDRSDVDTLLQSLAYEQGMDGTEVHVLLPSETE